MTKAQAGLEALNKALQVGMSGQYPKLTVVRISPSQNAGLIEPTYNIYNTI